MNVRNFKNFQITIDHRGVATITLDVPNHPMNLLNEEVMQELALIVSDLEHADGVRLAVIQSGKESGFLAGADVHVIANIHSAEHAGNLIDTGQRLFARIEALPMPTLVVIHGVCLGGGLELSLACDFRIARNNSSTTIGLPEIKLGLIPGWGGTQRLPQLVGLSTALEMILKGHLLDATKALAVGLIDNAIDPDHWIVGVDQFIDELIAGKVIKRHHAGIPQWQRWLDNTNVGRWLSLKLVQRSVASKAHDYPALGSAVKAVKGGYATERSEFVKLLLTPTCRNLLDLYFARESARKLKTWVSDFVSAVHEPPIRKIGIVGAGAMGAGIGQLAAYRGFDVVLKEIDNETMESGRNRITALVDELVKQKRFSQQQQSDLMDKITLSCEDASLADTDLVIEAVVEREDIKQLVYKSLDETVKQTSILASNTSSLSIARMAKATQRPHLVAGLHFFNPVHRMELVEVVRAAETDDITISRLVTFVRAMGKTPIVTSDSPGFLVNRVLFPYLGEAVLMVGESYQVREIDREIRRFGMPMGPLELLDQVGIDVALHVAKSLKDVLPGVGRVIPALDAMVQEGHLGKKSGQGFYHYKSGKPSKPALVDFMAIKPRHALTNDHFADDGLNLVQRRLVYPMLVESIRCLEEHVVEQAWAIDLAMVLGTGFAPHRGGPLHVVDAMGADTMLINLQRLPVCDGERAEPPKRLVEFVEKNERFFPHAGVQGNNKPLFQTGGQS